VQSSQQLMKMCQHHRMGSADRVLKAASIRIGRQLRRTSTDWARLEQQHVAVDRPSSSPVDGRHPQSGRSNILPTNASRGWSDAQKVPSSVYGSDAVGGVINFITRKPLRRVKLMAAGYGNSITPTMAAFLSGKTWARMVALLAYSYSYRSVSRGGPDRIHIPGIHLAGRGK